MTTILATFDLQVTSILPVKFESNCSFGSVEKSQNRFSKCNPGTDGGKTQFLEPF